MKRISISMFVLVLLFASAPARADVITQLLFEGGAKLIGAVVNGTINTVKEAIVSSESAEEKSARRQREIEQTAEQILQQYPADQRDAMRSQVIERLAMTQAQYEAMEARQKSIAAEQNSVGNILVSTTVGAATSAIGNHITIDAAARAASMRARF